MQENQEVVDVYWLCKNQLVITPTGKILDLNYSAVLAAMTLLGIPAEQRKDVFLRVVKVFWHFEERYR